MSDHIKGKANASSENIEFKWGRKEQNDGKKHDRQYYRSFTYDGVDYFLYDSVYIWCEGQPEPYIGKLTEIYETKHLEKKVKVVWYFHPTHVQKYLRGTQTLNNELFLASGVGQGLFNVNPLETIAGKCDVVCTSKDKRNPQASIEEVEMCDYVFYKTFDVEKLILSERFPDKIAGVEVGFFFNQRKHLEIGTPPKSNWNSKVAGKSNSSSKFETGHCSTAVEDESDFRVPPANIGRLTISSTSEYHLNKRKLQDSKVEPEKPTKRPKLDSSNWFKEQPWEERMQIANETGSLVLLENLDPSLTSLEVEDIVLDAFHKKASAKMIQCNAYSSPYNGQALVIFNSKDEADFAISELKTRCLMLGDLRPIVGSRPSLKETSKKSRYFGHLTIKTMKQMRSMDLRNVVSTSHFSQPNTIEFEMALEWCTLQMRLKFCWDALYKHQGKEIADLKTQLSNHKD
ncbi:protein ANTI-SILENCING 1 isoform X2 [Lactuca sativa]|uniref:protein ANTI-SILENCING 1 isoform X2 n=1 Tax=Lactuca sativa TaxID=4236 RepID=UPI000CBD822E|nr:protein ANTI-SILENCING 1 isoform X2 [Lactuca sativa]